MKSKILKFQRKKLDDDQVYICAKLKSKLKAAEWKRLRADLNAVVEDFQRPAQEQDSM